MSVASDMTVSPFDDRQVGAAMPKSKRTPERAAAVLDRAARMRAFRPGVLDRGLGGDKIKAPGQGRVSFDYNTIDPKALKSTGIREIPLKDLVTNQPTVSVKAVKEKLLNPNARASSANPIAILDPQTGKYVLADGVHRRATAAALGQTHMRVATAEIARQAQTASTAAAPTRTPLPRGAVAGAAALGAVAPIVSGVNARNRALASGATATDANGQAVLAAGATAGMGLGAAGVLRAAVSIAPRIAPMLGPAGLAVAGGAAAYGAYQGYQKSGGTLEGLLKGAVGLDVEKPSPTGLAASFAAAKAAMPAGSLGPQAQTQQPAEGDTGKAVKVKEHVRADGTKVRASSRDKAVR
jgi:hypothetical protein